MLASALRRSFKKVFFVLLGAICALPAHAALTVQPQGTDLQVNSYTAADQLHPALASDAAGNFVALWVDKARGLFIRRFDATGAPLTGEVRVDDPPIPASWLARQDLPRIAMDGRNGNFVVVYSSSDGIWFRRFNSSLADVSAFPDTAPAAASALVSSEPPFFSEVGVCAADALCLAGGRFRVTVDFTDPRNHSAGRGQAHGLTGDTGAFWFFASTNLELMVKVLDGPHRQRQVLGLLRRPLGRRLHVDGDRHPNRPAEDLPQPRRHPRQPGGHAGVLKKREIRCASQAV